MNWKSDKSGNHFTDDNKPGISSLDSFTENNNHSQTSSLENHDAMLATKLFAEKQEAKARRLEGAAEYNRIEAARIHKYNDQIAGIMNGTPILIGHYSEGRHRNALDKMHKSEGKAFEMSHHADNLDKRADNARNPYAINSSDPDAIVKLKNRINRFEQEKADKKERLKTAPDGSNFTDGTKANLRMYMSALTVNIRSTKKRIDEVQAKQDIIIPESDKKKNGVEMIINQEDDRVQLKFPGRPNQEVLTALKRRGWRWTPSKQLWQRNLNESSIDLANDILEMNQE